MTVTTEFDRRQRVVTFVAAGCAALLVGFAIVRLIDQKLVWRPAPSRASWQPPEDWLIRKNGLAPVLLTTEWTSGEIVWRHQKTLHLTLRKGQIFDDNALVAASEVRAYINAAMAQRGLDYVMLFPVEDTNFRELMPAIDECRQSNARIVLLEGYSLPR